MLKEESLDMAKELRAILGSIKGSKRVEEQFSLSYIVVVDDEESKENVQKVAEELVKQAEGKNLELEIAAATEQEIEQIREKLMEHMAANTTFKA